MATPSSAEDDIAYLRQLAEAGASGLPSGGKHFLVWAIVIATGMGLTYGSVSGVLPLGKDVINYWWAMALGTGWVASFVIGRAEAARPENLRLVNRITSTTWIATGIGLTAMWLGLTVSGAAHQALMMPIAGAALGVANAVSATVFRLTWLYAVAAAWWIVAFVSFLMIDTVEFILFSAVAIVVLQGGTGLALIVLERRRAR
jgi:hypothetical protein